MTGYAIYFHGLELIAAGISENNITFELEHDAEIIADNLKIKGTADKSGREIVEEVMRYIVELGLYEEDQDHIYCMKLLKRLDMSMTSTPKLRKTISDAKKRHDVIMINHENPCKKRREEKRRDKNIGAVGELTEVLSTVPNEQLRLSLMDWIDNRKTMKKPVTTTALQRAIKSLSLWYPDDIKTQIECVERSIINCWVGIFPTKAHEQKKQMSLSDYMKLTPEEQDRARKENAAQRRN